MLGFMCPESIRSDFSAAGVSLVDEVPVGPGGLPLVPSAFTRSHYELLRAFFSENVPAGKDGNPAFTVFELGEALVDEAAERLYSFDPILRESIPLLIREILFFESAAGCSGSSSSDPGIVVLGWHPSWTTDTVAELILHEATHQRIYLMSANDRLMDSKFSGREPEATSSILKRKRPYSLAFHAFVVSLHIAEYYAWRRMPAEAKGPLLGASNALPDLKDKSTVLVPSARSYLEEAEGLLVRLRAALSG